MLSTIVVGENNICMCVAYTYNVKIKFEKCFEMIFVFPRVHFIRVLSLKNLQKKSQNHQNFSLFKIDLRSSRVSMYKITVQINY